MNTIKNFLYDISDLVLSLLIIGIIFVVVSWKLTDTMAMSWFQNIDNTEITDLEFAEVTTPESEIILPAEDPEETPVEVVEVDPENEIEIIEVKDVTFTVEPGSTGYRIAKKLQEETLISDVDEFLLKLDELGLGSKLRAGNFKLNTGMTVVEIINTLAGQ